jgi:hypothetical protein
VKRIFMPMLAAVELLATDHSGVRPRGGPKIIRRNDSVSRFTIAASVVPAGKVKHQLSSDVLKAGYTVSEIAVFRSSLGAGGFRITSSSRHWRMVNLMARRESRPQR